MGAEKASSGGGGGVMGNEATSTKLPSNGKIIAACASDAKCAIKMQNGCKSSLSVHPFPLSPFPLERKAVVMKHSKNDAKKYCKEYCKNTVKKFNAIQMRIAMDDIRLTKLRVAECVFEKELSSQRL